MNKNKKLQALVIILIEGIVVYFILTFLILGPLFKNFYVGAPASGEVPFITSYISLGFAVAYVTIAMTIYPVLKFKEGGDATEE